MKIGQMQQSKAGNYFIKLGAGLLEGSDSAVKAAAIVELLGADVLFLQKPSDYIDFQLEKGDISEAVAEERRNKIPEFIKFNVNLPKG